MSSGVVSLHLSEREDEGRPRAVSRRLEGIKIAEIKSLIAEGRAEAQTGEMIRHASIKHHSRGQNEANLRVAAPTRRMP